MLLECVLHCFRVQLWPLRAVAASEPLTVDYGVGLRSSLGAAPRPHHARLSCPDLAFSLPGASFPYLPLALLQTSWRTMDLCSRATLWTARAR
jgi:hypothetical protein